MTDTKSTVPGVEAAATHSPPPGPPFGRFSHDVRTRRTVWTDRTYGIYGFGPGEVVPTLDLMSSHVHPEDRPRWDAAVAGSLQTGATFCEWLRLVDTRRKVRTVLAVGYAAGAAGGVSVVSGFVVDLTAGLRRHREQETTRAVIDAAATRDLIEQAKGMMMVIFDLTEAQAFDLLRWHSSHNNIKLRDVAATLVERLVDPELSGTRPRERLTAILAGLKKSGGTARPPLPAPVATPRPATATPRTGGTTPAGRRISGADLPRTMVRAVSVAAVSITIADWLDPEQPLVYVNDAFATLTGYSSDEILGRNCRFLQGPDSDQRAVKEMRQALDTGRDVRSVLRNYRKDGTAFWNEVHLSAVRDDAGRITHYIGYQSDVSERVEREEQLRSLAYRDAGTDLPNAVAGAADLEAAVLTSRGRCFDLLCVITGDVDAAGARTVQRSAVERLRATLPADACLSVQDDQSFLLRLPLGGGDTDAVVAAIRDTMSRPETVGGFPTGLRVDSALRIGRARFPQDGSDAASLVGAATAAAQD
ncbi:PAS and ANTAR domain-containing protein [Nakamurella deserti]|uniref:PAS and ANTAR domain-containing protein n=1 Tax=Nakamurella deserti TaxID=2164074 RepID=UPI0014788CD3|nr:PAS and ANTAR domain-containing protein [Nakamurella deserti]